MLASRVWKIGLDGDSLGMDSVAWASAFMKMTSCLCQWEIDVAKGSKEAVKVMAVETLMKHTEVCFAFMFDIFPNPA